MKYEDAKVGRFYMVNDGEKGYYIGKCVKVSPDETALHSVCIENTNGEAEWCRLSELTPYALSKEESVG